MINTTLYWLLLVPIIIGAVHLFTLRKNWREGLVVTAVSTLVGALVTVGAFYISVGTQTADVEIWNGKVTGKERKHGHYLRSYDCRCRDVCSGSGNTRSCSRQCDTCYEDRYTVHWYCYTTLGTITIDSEDWTSRRVYGLPDVPRWVSIKVDEPVAVAKSYTNYVQAVPQALFTPASGELKQKFASIIPAYPDKPYDFYRIDRFLAPGLQVPDAKEWSWDIGVLLNDRGAKKEVNVIVVAVNTNDPRYEFALRDAWQNGNKNDVIVVMGTPSWPKIEWVRIITWSKSEIFKVELRDRILQLGEADRATVLPAIADQIDKNFVRRSMRDFEYLQAEIDPPNWVITTMIVLQVLAAAGVQYWIHTHFYTNRRRGFRPLVAANLRSTNVRKWK